MTKNDALNRYGCGRDSSATEQRRDNPEHEPAGGAQPVAATTRQTSTLQLCPEDGSVLLLVRLELRKLRDERPGREASHQDLTGIDADSTVLTGVVDLQHAA